MHRNHSRMYHKNMTMFYNYYHKNHLTYPQNDSLVHINIIVLHLSIINDIINIYMYSNQTHSLPLLMIIRLECRFKYSLIRNRIHRNNMIRLDIDCRKFRHLFIYKGILQRIFNQSQSSLLDCLINIFFLRNLFSISLLHNQQKNLHIVYE